MKKKTLSVLCFLIIIPSAFAFLGLWEEAPPIVLVVPDDVNGEDINGHDGNFFRFQAGFIFGGQLFGDGSQLTGLPTIIAGICDNNVACTITGTVNTTLDANFNSLGANFFFGNGSGLTGIDVNDTSLSLTGLEVPLGTVNNPSIWFAGDLGTGMYSPGSTELAFAIDTVQIMRIDDTNPEVDITGNIQSSESITATYDVTVGRDLNVAVDSNLFTVSAGFFFGDGSGLTGILSGGGTDTLDVNAAERAYLFGLDLNGVDGYFVGLSNDSYTGDIRAANASRGYPAANYICDDNYSGSHICTTDEIINSIVSQDISSWTGTGWMAEGAPGFTANANDCVGLTDSTGSYLGAFWDFNNTTGGEGWLTACNGTKQLTCCR